METIYFLIFIGICAVAVVWATRSSKEKTGLARKNRNNRTRQVAGKLTTPPDNPLAHSDQVWEQRRKRAAMDAINRSRFMPKSEAGLGPVHDGYSRSDRHHMAPKGVVKEEDHPEDDHELAMTSIKFKHGDLETKA